MSETNQNTNYKSILLAVIVGIFLVAGVYFAFQNQGKNLNTNTANSLSVTDLNQASNDLDATNIDSIDDDLNQNTVDAINFAPN